MKIASLVRIAVHRVEYAIDLFGDYLSDQLEVSGVVLGPAKCAHNTGSRCTKDQDLTC